MYCAVHLRLLSRKIDKRQGTNGLSEEYFFLGPLHHPSFLPPAEAASFAPCLPTDYSHGTRIKEKRGGRRGLFFLPENGCMCCMSQGSFHIHFVYCVYMHKYAVEREEATVDLGRPKRGRIFLERPLYSTISRRKRKES